jgi:hypothetical protein
MFCDGQHLLYCKEQGVKFELLKEYVCDTTKNFFKNMISDYYDKTSKIKDKDFVKDCLNFWIGKMQHGCDTIKQYENIVKICNNDESKMTDGYIIDYNDDYKFKIESSSQYKIYTRKLLDYQIKNMSRREIYEKMKELKLTDNDIIQIKVDAITMRGKRKIKGMNANNFRGWKYLDDYDAINDNFKYTNDISNINDNKTNNILFEGYAGCGKTYRIINKIIPQLKDSYIVLSPSHSSIEEYRNNNINCNVIQKYSFSNTIPNENIIIIDEIGLCDTKANDVIYKCSLAGKKIISYGDYRQLLPVKSDRHLNNSDYIKYLYNKHFDIESNYRNVFTKEYYDKLINNKLNLIDEIKKYRTKKYMNAGCVICSTNAKCKIWNDKIMKKLNIEFGDIGTKVMCKTNKLRDKDIYNNFMFVVSDVSETHISIKDNNNNIIEISRKQFFKYFQPSYARTTYNIQGKSLKSFYVPDSDLYNFNNPRSAYTIISRLKTDDVRSTKIKKCSNKCSNNKIIIEI